MIGNKITASINELFQKGNELAKLDNVTGSIKFTYAIGKNKKIIQGAVKRVQKKLARFSKEYNEFTIKVKELEAERSRDLAVENITPNAQAGIQTKFKASIDTLEEDNKAIIDAAEKVEKDNQKMLEEEVEVALHPIKLSDMPKEIKVNEMGALLDMLDEASIEAAE